MISKLLSEVSGRVGHGLVPAWFESYVLCLVFFKITRTRETLWYLIYPSPHHSTCSSCQLSVETYSTRPKNLSEFARSIAAAVHINSRKNIAYAHACTIRVLNGLYTAICVQKNEEQPKLNSWCSNSRGMGLLKRWVVVCVASLPSPEQP